MSALGLLTQFGLSRATGGGGGASFTGITSWATPGTASSYFQRVGWEFQVGASPITVTALRHFGRSNGAVWRVMIHRVSDGAEIASADITSVNGAWAEESVSGTLEAGVNYRISGRAVSGSTNLRVNPTDLVLSDAISYVNSGNSYTGAGDDMPTGDASGVYVPVADFRGTI